MCEKAEIIPRFRNITELTEVVTNAAYFLGTIFKLAQNGPNVSYILEDYPDCGIRNNDTFNFAQYNSNPPFNDPFYGSEATANWSVECLWDCTWKINPYVGQTYLFTDTKNPNLQVNITLAMPKIPVDLRCLDGCTDVKPPALRDLKNDQPFDCSNSMLGSFLGCYIYNNQLYETDIYTERNGTFLSTTYFHMAIESCIIAILKPNLYPEGNCDQLGVNLRFFNGLLSPPHLSNSLPVTTKLQGPGSEGVLAFGGPFGLDALLKNRYPWLCSLRTAGYRGVHRCGVTLLSAPPKPTIFVSAAHCNYVCKDDTGRVVEICCCRDISSNFSCAGSSFCGSNKNLQLADPQDLQIICNLISQEALPQGIGYPNATVFNIREIRNHPSYTPLMKGSSSGGPIGGYDISVYIVDDSNFKANKNSTWPACLPKTEDSYLAGNRGILAGWNDPRPTAYVGGVTVQDYANRYLVVREALLERQPACKDPAWMRSNTYYPPGTACYLEAAWAASVEFGLSGSGLVRPFTTAEGATRYSWVGPLSMSKGSDRSVLSDYSGLINYSSNPSVFTDAHCYLDWIAAQYGLSLPADYTKPASCGQSTGEKLAVNNTNCLSRALIYTDTTDTPEKCQFTANFSRCMLYAEVGRTLPLYNLNFYYCINIRNQQALCANDCLGVDPNAIVIGGEVALISVAAGLSGGPNLLGPALGGVVGVAGLGIGGVVMGGNRTRFGGCPANECRAQRGTTRCCRFFVAGGQRLCPFEC
jgi:hypothetical protein